MNKKSWGVHARARFLAKAVVFGSVAAIVTAAAVSWATPDGNLVVTSVPALAVGLAVFGLARWRFRRGWSAWQGPSSERIHTEVPGDSDDDEIR